MSSAPAPPSDELGPYRLWAAVAKSVRNASAPPMPESDENEGAAPTSDHEDDDNDNDTDDAVVVEQRAQDEPPPAAAQRGGRHARTWVWLCWTSAVAVLALACLGAQAYLLATLLAGAWRLHADVLAPHEREQLLRAQFEVAVAARDAAARWLHFVGSLADTGAHCVDVARRIAVAVFAALRV